MYQVWFRAAFFAKSAAEVPHCKYGSIEELRIFAEAPENSLQSQGYLHTLPNSYFGDFFAGYSFYN